MKLLIIFCLLFLYNLYPSDTNNQIQNIQNFDNIKQKLEALSSGEIDAFINSDNVVNYYINKYGYSNLKISEPTEKTFAKNLNNHYFATSKQNPYLISILNKAYDNLSIFELQELNKKWFGKTIENFKLTLKEKSYLQKHNPFTICTQDNFYPYDGVIDNKLSGVMGKYFENISELTEIKFIAIKPSSPKHLNELEANGECDLITIMGIDTPRFKNIKSTKAFISLNYALITSTKTSFIDNKKLRYEDMEFFVQYIGQKESLKKEYPSLNIKVEQNLDKVLKKVSKNHKIILLIPKLQAHQIISHYGYEHFKENGMITSNYNTSIGVKDSEKTLLNIINKSINFLESKNTYNYILDKFWPTQYIVEKSHKYFWYTFIVLSIIIIALIYRYKELNEKNKLINIEKNKINAILQNIPDLLWIKDTKGIYLACNKRFESFYGAKEDDIIGKTDYDFVDRELADFFRKHDKLAMDADKALTNFEEVPFKSDGHKEYLQTTKVKINDNNGNVIGVLGIGRDLTELISLTDELKYLNQNLEIKVKEQTQKIIQQKEELEKYFETMIDGLLVVDVIKRKIIDCNKAFEKIIGYTKEELLQISITELSPKESKQYIIDSLEEMIKDMNALDITIPIIRKDSRVIMCNIDGSIYHKNENIYAIGIFRDITEKLKIEKELKENKQKLELALNENLFGYWEFDLENNIVTFSEAGYKILGYKDSSDFDTDTITWIQRVHPDDLESSIKEYNKLIDGTIEKYNITHRVLNKNKAYIWLDVSAIASKRDLNGKALVTIGIFRDITFQKELENELKKLNNQLEEQNENLEERVKEEVTKSMKQELLLTQQQKQAQMGAMIGNIAHQFRQPLGTISMIASNILFDLKLNTLEKENIIDNMNSIIERTNYLSNTITIFRNFLKEHKEFKEVILQDRIDMALKIVNMNLSDYGIELINNVDYNKKIKVKLITGELAEVIINIINNAKDILLEKNVESPWIKIDLEKDEKKATISIEDNGGGIPENILSNIFDKYFTTKDKELGTGLGLYMSKKIIEESLNGKLYVKNSKNGAKFFIDIMLDNSKIE